MNNFIEYIIKYIDLIRISDVVDILIVSVIIYYLIKLLRETRAMQLVKGLLILFAVFVASDWFKLNTMHYLLSSAMQIGMFALMVIFQPELRSMLERVGRLKVGNFLDLTQEKTTEQMNLVIESVVKAACDMSGTKTGALIVFERQTKLGEVIRTGTPIDASVTSRLLENIFVPNTPLHDGAVIISKCRVAAASCLLRLTDNNNLSRDLGTRHRAAIGVTETSDAVVVVVSEETGKISIALDGTLTRNLNAETLTNALRKTLIGNSDAKFRPAKGLEKFKIRRVK